MPCLSRVSWLLLLSTSKDFVFCPQLPQKGPPFFVKQSGQFMNWLVLVS